VKYFLDTSALVKIYHKEVGTEKVLNIYEDKSDIVISELSKVEFISTIHRKFRDGEIDEKTKSLRSLDSIQLTFFETYCDNKDIFVCSDVKLIEITKIENCKVLTP